MPIDEVERAFPQHARHRISSSRSMAHRLRVAAARGRGRGVAAAARHLRLGGRAASRDSRGRTAGGLLHAPSHAQAYTAIVLRDRAISDPEAARWKMNLDSAAVRSAEGLGAPACAPADISPKSWAPKSSAWSACARRLKDCAPRFQFMPNDTGRRVCDGVAVLAANPARTRVAQRHTRRARGPSPRARRVPAICWSPKPSTTSCRPRRNRRRCHGCRRRSRAAAALEVLHTPRSGRTVATTVVFCASPTVRIRRSRSTPARRAWPIRHSQRSSESTTGAPDSANWTWDVDPANGAMVSITLASLGLSPWDAAVLGKETLDSLVVAAQVLMRRFVQHRARSRPIGERAA